MSMSLNSQKTRIAIIDDHPLLRQGMAALINSQADFTVCGQADEAKKAIETVKTTNPDILILDISLKGANGLEVLKDLKVQFPGLRVLILSMHDENIYAPRSLRAGASGYITKQEASDKVLVALRKIKSGDVYLSQDMQTKMLNRVAGRTSPMASPVETLSDRELEILTLLGQGVSTSEIAQRLNLSIKTVETHRAHIKEKLNLKTAPELVHYAVDWVQSESR